MFSQTIISEQYNTTYTDFFREASLKRYGLHQYQYSNLHKASTDGSIYFKPMFYNFPDDSKNYNDVEKNILLGDSVKLSAVVDQVTVQTFYFPGTSTTWCPIWPKYKFDCYSGKSTQVMSDVKNDEMLVHIKSGSIIPLQLTDFELTEQDTTRDYSAYQNKVIHKNEDYNIETLKDHTLDLAVMCDSKYHAEGWVRFDDGKTQDLTQYSEFSFEAQGAVPLIGTNSINITANVTKDNSTLTDSNNQKLGSILIYNANKFSLSKNSKCSIALKSSQTIQADPICYFTNKKSSICRFLIKDGLEPDLRDIENIYITSR